MTSTRHNNHRQLNVCVIGAGPSGIASIKELKALNHKVTCFEKQTTIGGVFSGDGSYDSLLLTISNYFIAFSDFMPTHERLKFWTCKEYISYLKKYIEHFDLENNIQFGKEIISVKKEEEHWVVEVKENQKKKSYIFDAVAVCSGLFRFEEMPKIKGMHRFKGEILHSKQFKNATPFIGKRVLCIGIGESSSDITVEIGEVANKTILSLRRYPMIAPRYPFIGNARGSQYLTIDVGTSRALNSLPRDIHTNLHRKIFSLYKQSYDPATRLRGAWNLKAGVESNQVITKNERIFTSIIDNKIQVNLSGIKELTENEVVFQDNTKERIDTIMCCTGFQFKIPFIELEIKNTRDLYKQMFYRQLGSSLALIGFARPQQGGVPVIAELQARYFALLCSGQRQFPSQDMLEQQIEKDKKRWESEFCITPHVSSLVNYSHFMEDLARLIHCEPKVSFWKSPRFFLKYWFGPQLAIQYRLRGPGAISQQAYEIITKALTPYGKRRYILLAAFIYWFRKILPFSKRLKPRYI